MKHLTCHIDGPRREFSTLDSLKQSLGSIIWIFTSELQGSGVIKGLIATFSDAWKREGIAHYLETTVSPEVDLRVDEGVVILHPFECVPRVSMLLVEAIGSATV